VPRAKKMQTTGGPYGQQAELDRAQQAVPAGPAVTDPAPVMGPDSVPNLSDPTNRPDEPITAGLPFGPGPGRNPYLPTADPTLEAVRAMYMMNPSPHLRRMLRQLGG
jgi:hypothetical protein